MAQRTRLADRVNDGNAKWFTLAAACFALFMAILDNLVVNVALPTITSELGSSPTQLLWIVSAYTLVFASLQITAGGLGDRLGRKRWFLIGIAIFTGTSVLAAFAQNTETLIAARALQGLGGAFILPLSLSLISEAFPPEERGKALGIWSAISVSGIALGPIVGGLLVQYASWNWVFLINVPIGVGAFIVTSAVVKESRDESGTVASDIPGTVLITAALASLVWGLIQAGERGWGDGLILTAFALAAVLTVVFVVVESRTERPMIPLRFFRSHTFTGANVAAFAVSFLIAGIAFSMTLYQQNVHGFSPVRSGLALLPMVAMMMIGAPLSGSLVNRFGAGKLIATGMLIGGLGALLFLRSDVDASYLDIVPGLVVFGIGMSFIFAPMTTAVLNSVETAKSGVASAVNGAIRETGFAFGIALLGTIMNRAYQDRFAESNVVQGLRADPNAAPLAPVLDRLGSGVNYAGRVLLEDDRFAAAKAALGPAATQIADVSGRAFVAGMDRAFIISAAFIMVSALISLVLIKDRIADPTAAPAPFGEPQLRPEGAD